MITFLIRKIVNFLFKERSSARIAYDSSINEPLKYPQYMLPDNKPIKVKLGTLEVPEFTKELAIYHRKSLEKYIETFLVNCLYMEQGLSISSGRTLDKLSDSTSKHYIHVQGPKNPKEC